MATKRKTGKVRTARTAKQVQEQIESAVLNALCEVLHFEEPVEF